MESESDGPSWADEIPPEIALNVGSCFADDAHSLLRYKIYNS